MNHVKRDMNHVKRDETIEQLPPSPQTMPRTEHRHKGKCACSPSKSEARERTAVM